MSFAPRSPEPNAGTESGGTTRCLAGLNTAQVEAVTYEGGPLLVVAGAGSGKTRTLASRVAYLIASGVEPEDILLLTFTRRAARELLTRASGALGSRDATRVWGGTFHSVCQRLLKHFGSIVGLPGDFTLVDQVDALELMGNCRQTVLAGEPEARRFPQAATLVAIYSRTANTQVALTDVITNQFPWCTEYVERIIRIFRLYAAKKSDLHSLDFDDLLLYVRSLAQADRGAEVLSGLFKHILVDEYQDVNSLEAEIVGALAGSSRNLTAVGDDAQAIFGFRGATPDAMHNFGEAFAGAKLVTLDENYRSTPEILKVANAIMSEARTGYPKALFTGRSSGRRPTIATCIDETVQAAYVCDQILEYRESDVPLREQAVLFRTGHHSDVLEVELKRRDIPFVKFGGLKFLEAAHVRDFVAMLRIVENPRDELAWRRVLGLVPHVGPVTTNRILDGIRQEPSAAGRAVLDAFLSIELALPADALQLVDELQRVLHDCADLDSATRSSASGRSIVGAQAERLVYFCEKAFPYRYGNAQVRIIDIDELASLAAHYQTRAEFLTDLTLDPPASTSDFAGSPRLDDDYLILSTIHSAKGGEWDIVYVIHAADGCMPSDMALGSPGGLEEERRLAYVASTRARKSLHVSYPLRFFHHRHRHDDDHSLALPSRFFNSAITVMDRVTIAAPEPSGPGDRSISKIDAALEPVETGLADLWV